MIRLGTLVIALAALCCSQPWPPSRPSGVPSDASWIGPAHQPTPTPRSATSRSPTWWPTPGASRKPEGPLTDVPGWIRCEDSDGSDPNAFRCTLYAAEDGRLMKQARFVLVRELPCDCPLSVVSASVRRLFAKQLRFVGYDSQRGWVILVDGDALVEL